MENNQVINDINANLSLFKNHPWEYQCNDQRDRLSPGVENINNFVNTRITL